MTVINDLITEITTYALQNVTLGMVSVNWQQGAPNPNEWATCVLRITNNGHLGMTNTVLLVKCSDHALVSIVPPIVVPNPVPFQPQFPLSIGEVGSHSSKQVTFYIMAVKATQPYGTAEQLFGVHLLGHDLTLDPILKEHAGNEQRVATSFNGPIYPT